MMLRHQFSVKPAKCSSKLHFLILFLLFILGQTLAMDQGVVKSKMDTASLFCFEFSL